MAFKCVRDYPSAGSHGEKWGLCCGPRGPRGVSRQNPVPASARRQPSDSYGNFVWRMISRDRSKSTSTRSGGLPRRRAKPVPYNNRMIVRVCDRFQTGLATLTGVEHFQQPA